MKPVRLSLPRGLNLWFSAVVVLLSVALFLIAYFLLYRAVQGATARSCGRSLEVYRAWYAEGGLPALNYAISRTARAAARSRSSSACIGPQRAALFVELPKHAGALDLTTLENMTPDEAFALAWIRCRHEKRAGRWLSWPQRDCPTAAGCRWAKRPRR